MYTSTQTSHNVDFIHRELTDCYQSSQEFTLLSPFEEKLLENYPQLLFQQQPHVPHAKVDVPAVTIDHIMTENTIKLVEAISTIPDGSYVLAIISGLFTAITAALLAFIVNVAYQKHLYLSNKSPHFANIALRLLEEFENDITEYWLMQKGPMINQRKSQLESKIKSRFTLLRGCLDEFSKSTKQLGKRGQKHSEIVDKFADDLYDMATGDDFESRNDQSGNNQNRVSILYKFCNKLKGILLIYSQHVNN